MNIKIQHIIYLSFIIMLTSCGSISKDKEYTGKEEPVVIKNDSVEYEITIIDPGFNNYLVTVARPPGYHSQIFLENKNRYYVSIWNSRVNNPSRFNPNIYENIILYDPHVDYGYDVNYKLFNYFEFAQQKYRMRLQW
ncbi:DUF6146 family protein [Tenacibaculum sp. MEBiC06402]|uniref:DUF6146 family protein n=1 Tax=unclassified Tenacibaculum TaxID=2635139 RepID=UPI003B9B8471